MTVATKTQPNYTTQQAAAYKAAIDGITAVHDRLAGAFAPHEQDVGSPAPDLSMRVDAGPLLVGTTLTEVAAQTVSGFTTPSAGEERIDRVVIDATTGVATRVAGTAVSGSPSAVPPDIPSGKLPCCQIRFTDASTAILNTMITDERIGPIKLDGVLQRAYGEYTANADLANTVVADDSIPQNTEGTEILTVSITPKNPSSKIRIRVQGIMSGPNTAGGAFMVFKDSDADAIGASIVTFSTAAPTVANVLELEVDAGSTSARTYKLRAGGTSTVRLNGATSGRYFGGVMRTTMTVEEIL